jgi:hypothetical protein
MRRGVLTILLMRRTVERELPDQVVGPPADKGSFDFARSFERTSLRMTTLFRLETEE